MKYDEILKRVLSVLVILIIYTVAGMSAGILLMFIPCYFYIESKLSDVKIALAAGVAYLAAMSFLIGTVNAAYMGLILLPLIIVFDTTTKRELPISISLALQAALIFVPLIALYGGSFNEAGSAFVEYVTELIEGDAQVREMVMANFASVDTFLALLRKFADAAVSMMPSILMIFGLITAYINHKIAGVFLFKRRGLRIVQPSSFYLFTLPQGFMLGAFISYFSMIVLYSVTSDVTFFVIDNNIAAITLFLLAVSGASFMDFFLIRLDIPRVFRVFLILFLFLLQVPITVFVVLGVLDTVFKMKFRSL